MMLQMIVMMVTVYVLGVEFRYRQGKQWLKKGRRQSAKSLDRQTFALYFSAPLCRVVDELSPFWAYRRTPPHPDVQRSAYHFCFSHHYQIIAITLVSLLPNFRSALTIGSGFTAIAFSFAAYTFPMEGLPKSMQYLAQIFPYAHFMKYYVNRAIKGIPVEMTWQPLLALLLFGLLLIVAYPMFVKKIKSGGYETI